jgi:glycosyltransferase involved in cell wall biosynthesis
MTLALSMIVKDEQDVILRCLRSVYRYIDTWCIVDTGSSDATIQLITDFFKQKGLTGRLHQRPWVDFEWNRNEALTLTRELCQEGDHVIWLDADEEFIPATGFRLPTLAGSYSITEYRGCKLAKTRIFPAFDYDWWYPIHEVLVHNGRRPAVAGGTLANCHINSHFDGARGKDGARWLRDAETLDKAIAVRERGELWREHPLELSRLYFYSGNSYFSAGQYQQAIDRYRQRIALAGFPEEVFQAYYMIARCRIGLKQSVAETTSAFLEAWFYRPSRYEPLTRLLQYLLHHGLHEQALLFAPSLSKAVVPADILFVEENLYTEGRRLARQLLEPTTADRLHLATVSYQHQQWSAVLSWLKPLKVKTLTVGTGTRG